LKAPKKVFFYLYWGGTKKNYAGTQNCHFANLLFFGSPPSSPSYYGVRPKNLLPKLNLCRFFELHLLYPYIFLPLPLQDYALNLKNNYEKNYYELVIFRFL